MEATVSPNVETDHAPAAVANSDKHIWGIFIALCIISVIELYSASSREVSSSSIGVIGPIVRHLIMLLGGALIVWLLSRRHYRDFIPLTFGFALISIVMMVYVMFFGDIVNGARRSLTILGIGIYPAEMVKLSSVLIVALVMTWNQNPKDIGITTTGVKISAIVILVFSLLLVKQGLTNTLLLIAISYSMMVIGGVKLRHLLVVTITYAACGGVFLLFLSRDDAGATDEIAAGPATEITAGASKVGPSRFDTWVARFDRFFDKSKPKYEMDIDAKNRQEMYSFMAQANGGVMGVFPGNSREASRLPLAFSDYIYAIIIEEMGLVGGLVVLLLYLWLLGRAAGIASRCNRTYPALLVMGMSVLIAFQALFHMAIVTGVFPVSGQPLPLISKGGTSIVVTAIAFGIMLSVSRTATRQGNKRQEIKEEIDALPEQFRDENPMKL